MKLVVKEVRQSTFTVYDTYPSFDMTLDTLTARLLNMPCSEVCVTDTDGTEYKFKSPLSRRVIVGDTLEFKEAGFFDRAQPELLLILSYF